MNYKLETDVLTTLHHINIKYIHDKKGFVAYTDILIYLYGPDPFWHSFYNMLELYPKVWSLYQCIVRGEDTKL